MKLTLRVLLCIAACTPSLADAQEIVIGLITKTETNPFFVKMKEGAEAGRESQGRQADDGAGKIDGDNAGQVTAIENMIAAGAKTHPHHAERHQGDRPGDQEGARQRACW